MYAIGIVTGVALTLVVTWLIKKYQSLRWYEWAIGGLGVGAVIAAVQHYFGSIREFEEKSAWIGALVFGLIALLLFALAWQLIARRQKATAG